MSRRPKDQNRLIRVLRVFLYRRRYTLTISALVLAAMVAGVMYYEWDVEPVKVPAPRKWSEIVESDTLRVVTIASSSTAFEYKGKWHGHEYRNAKLVADALGLKLQVLTVSSEQALADSLFSGAADLAITPLEYRLVQENWFLRPTGMRWADGQCLVSARRLDVSAFADSLLTDSMRAELPHYSLVMRQGSEQWKTYADDSVCAYFDFSPYQPEVIPSDSLTIEQITDSMVLTGRIDAVMMRCNVARLMHDFYPTLNISDTIPMSQDSLAWMVTAGADTLRYIIDSVAAEYLNPGTPHYVVAVKGYRRDYRHKVKRASGFVMRDGAISPYDDIFRRKGKEYGLDWRLLAGIAYIESNFTHEIVSSRGPIGLMQLMPQTVHIYGYEEEDALDPELNVDMACRLLCVIDKMVRNRYPTISSTDLIGFVLTGYNAGVGHLFDAINLADTLGYNPKVWPNNVEHCLRLKSDPQYYKMSVVKNGRFNGAFTINYVNEVTAAYHTFSDQMPLE